MLVQMKENGEKLLGLDYIIIESVINHHDIKYYDNRDFFNVKIMNSKPLD